MTTPPRIEKVLERRRGERGFLADAITMVANFMQGLGRAALFLWHMLLGVPAALARPHLVIQQMYMIGVLSLIIIVLSGSFIGMVMALQGYRALSLVGAKDALGIGLGLAILREFGPVVTALLFAGRAGSALAAEIGLMRATDQLSGMEMMAVDPIKRVIGPRFGAGFLAMPLLGFIFCVMALGVAGGHLVGVDLLGVDAGAYWAGIKEGLHGEDIRDCATKSFTFGLTCTWIALYQGYHSPPTSEGVARATTATVVISSLAVLALDFVLTAFMFR
ncbi:MAG TPA: lipid asymmetry maintenance ABC transporter permease subunit MlaE [Nevskiaceae bacterium]|nr:lipid asymmetry maintenance ABC transporter permease subunit MlaE [Nevskiaceae bacterium]